MEAQPTAISFIFQSWNVSVNLNPNPHWHVYSSCILYPQKNPPPCSDLTAHYLDLKLSHKAPISDIGTIQVASIKILWKPLWIFIGFGANIDL